MALDSGSGGEVVVTSVCKSVVNSTGVGDNIDATGDTLLGGVGHGVAVVVLVAAESIICG